ncbi:unnamed protein product [Calypogeia fissa]
MDHNSSTTASNGPDQLNDSIFEFHRPSKPTMQVLFFHGFQLENDYEDAHVTTWKSKDGSCVWPQAWLVEDFPNAHILCVSYENCLKNKGADENFDLRNIAENILSDILHVKIGQEEGCNIILVGHSFGGLVVKDLCLLAHSKGSVRSMEHVNFMNNVKGLFFYATPHHGMTIRLGEHFVSRGPLFQYVQSLSTAAARMHEEFENLRLYYGTWQIAGLGESIATKLGYFETNVLVVEASSRYGQFEIVQEDHLSICRPTNKHSKGFYALTQLLASFQNKFRVEFHAGATLRYGESLVSEGGNQCRAELHAGATLHYGESLVSEGGNQCRAELHAGATLRYGESLVSEGGNQCRAELHAGATLRYGESLVSEGGNQCRAELHAGATLPYGESLVSEGENQCRAELHAGATLPYGESLVSEGGNHTFKNQGDGNLVVYTKIERPIWSSGTWQKGLDAPGQLICNPRGDLKLLKNGNLVLYNTQATGLPIWASMSQGNEPRPHKLVMQDSGNLVIYDANLKPFWSSTTDRTSGIFMDVNGKNEMPSGVTWLRRYDKLVSKNRKYTLLNQGDGNVCIYNAKGDCTWATNTSWTGGAGNFYMQRDGNLVLYHDREGDGAPLWDSNTYGHGTGPYKLVMKNHGNLVVYDAHWNNIWASGTQ